MLSKETSSPDITKSKLRSTKYCYNSTKLNTKETIPRGQSIKTTMSQNLVSKYNI